MQSVSGVRTIALVPGTHGFRSRCPAGCAITAQRDRCGRPAQGPPAPARVEPKLASCDNPIDRNEALAASLGINGTPSLVSVDGRVMPGAATAEAIDQWLGAK
ncbi:thioredoxin fold domain-containing protein [Burkholderia glumae]|uniref:thioredoxin fold domain-containing protein n=1 Tax=Burkholderia glumae TaxID=337 RepID=UPI00214FE257|nr:thioredoxin fold domain-containing protein [Burkholderia glumae]